MNMKKKYTKKQIMESIKYWKKQLKLGNYKKLNESYLVQPRVPFISPFASSKYDNAAEFWLLDAYDPQYELNVKNLLKVGSTILYVTTSGYQGGSPYELFIVNQTNASKYIYDVVFSSIMRTVFGGEGGWEDPTSIDVNNIANYEILHFKTVSGKWSSDDPNEMKAEAEELANNVARKVMSGLSGNEYDIDFDDETVLEIGTIVSKDEVLKLAKNEDNHVWQLRYNT